jgi:DNA polymerase I
MDFELHPTITLRSRSFNVLQAPRELFIQALNRNLNLQRFKVLYVCGNYSRILSKLDRKFTDMEIRRAFTVFQLVTILEEARHILIIIEDDPLLYEDATGMIDSASQAMYDAGKEASVLLYPPGTDTFLVDMTRNADRVFYFDEEPRAKARIVSQSLSECAEE